MTSEYHPSLRLCDVERPSKGSCGFHLSRTQWDPYPWVSGVDAGSAAEEAGLRPGDCVLEVNGEDVLGERIGAVAAKVRARPDKVSLLLWNAGSDPHASVSLCGGTPTPLSLQRLSACLQAVLQLLECPVCLDTVPPPAYQCCNGHVLCGACRSRAERCPVCRVSMGPRGRCLLADKLHSLLTSTFNNRQHQKSKSKVAPVPVPQPQPLVQLKSRLILQSKASSVENMNSCPSDGDAQAIRARSLSTGQIPSNSPPSPGPEKHELMVHCPHGPDCEDLLQAPSLLHHLQESHEGPLVQYFPRTCGVLRMRLPQPGADLVSLTTADGSTMFLQVAVVESRKLVWLWLLGDEPAAGRHRMLLTLPQGEVRIGTIFSLSTAWADVIASNRCLTIEESCYVESSPEVQLEIVDMEVNKSDQ
ncbi:uncharacterized protein [Anabrus simplex]|uniref:uncharacterized protein n=1 Tax=Anabrus simplex TaxID=316456 RepID=UPI0035A39F98